MGFFYERTRDLLKPMWPFLLWVARPLTFAVCLLHQHRLELWRVEGHEAEGQSPLSILIGVSKSKRRSRSYLCSLAFGSAFHEQKLGGVWLWNICRAMAKKGRDCDLAFIVTDKCYRFLLEGRGSFEIPSWVYGEVDLAHSATLRKTKCARTDLCRIRQHALEYKITRNPRRFDEFYHDMYVPHITKTYEEAAHVIPYDEMRSHFEQGELLLVVKETEPIAGVLLSYEQERASLVSLGVPHGNREYLRIGAIGALYHFALEYLGEKGFKRAALGWSRSFLCDGVLQFKNRRCVQRLVATSPGKFVLRVLSHTAAAKAFLQRNPFIFENDGQLCGAVFVDGPGPLVRKDIERIEKTDFLPGMSRLFIYQLEPGQAADSDPVPESLAERIILGNLEEAL